MASSFLLLGTPDFCLRFSIYIKEKRTGRIGPSRYTLKISSMLAMTSVWRQATRIKSFATSFELRGPRYGVVCELKVTVGLEHELHGGWSASSWACDLSMHTSIMTA